MNLDTLKNAIQDKDYQSLRTLIGNYMNHFWENGPVQLYTIRVVYEGEAYHIIGVYLNDNGMNVTMIPESNVTLPRQLGILSDKTYAMNVSMDEDATISKIRALDSSFSGYAGWEPRFEAGAYRVTYCSGAALDGFVNNRAVVSSFAFIGYIKTFKNGSPLMEVYYVNGIPVKRGKFIELSPLCSGIKSLKTNVDLQGLIELKDVTGGIQYILSPDINKGVETEFEDVVSLSIQMETTLGALNRPSLKQKSNKKTELLEKFGFLSSSQTISPTPSTITPTISPEDSPTVIPEDSPTVSPQDSPVIPRRGQVNLRDPDDYLDTLTTLGSAKAALEMVLKYGLFLNFSNPTSYSNYMDHVDGVVESLTYDQTESVLNVPELASEQKGIKEGIRRAYSQYLQTKNTIYYDEFKKLEDDLKQNQKKMKIAISFLK